MAANEKIAANLLSSPRTLQRTLSGHEHYNAKRRGKGTFNPFRPLPKGHPMHFRKNSMTKKNSMTNLIDHIKKTNPQYKASINNASKKVIKTNKPQLLHLGNTKYIIQKNPKSSSLNMFAVPKNKSKKTIKKMRPLLRGTPIGRNPLLDQSKTIANMLTLGTLVRAPNPFSPPKGGKRRTHRRRAHRQ